MQEQRTLVVSRDCPARLVPVGTPITIKANTFVNLKQALGGTYTVTVNGNMARVDGTDADALGLSPMELEFPNPSATNIDAENVDYALDTVFDPEIPVSLKHLGLIYGVDINNDDASVKITMTLTAPGCGMGEVLVGDVKYRVGKVPHVAQVDVELVFDPPWSRDMMSEEAQLETGMF